MKEAAKRTTIYLFRGIDGYRAYSGGNYDTAETSASLGYRYFAVGLDDESEAKRAAFQRLENRPNISLKAGRRLSSAEIEAEELVQGQVREVSIGSSLSLTGF